MQDIVNTNSTKAIQTLFNNLFDIKNIAIFYAIGSSSPFIYYHSEGYQNLTIKNDTS